MKNRTKILIAFGIITALIVGFLIGVSVEYPKIDTSYASGTIGKIKNYRNIKATEADINFHNELLADTAKVAQLKLFYNFHYVNAAKLAGYIENAVKEANSAELFKEKNKASIDNLAEFGTFLTSARSDLLLELSALKSLKEINPGLFMMLTNQANNIIAQMNYRHRVIISFIDNISVFVNDNPSLDCTSLKRVHDLLSLNEVFNSSITRDKVTLKYFDKKTMFSDKESLNIYVDQAQLNLKSTIQMDMEKLNIIILVDMEKLGIIYTDKEVLNGIELDATALGSLLFLDPQTLNAFYGDNEKLGLFRINSNENLGILNTEKLGYLLNSRLLDVENLGIWDQEKLGTRFTDKEKLGWV